MTVQDKARSCMNQIELPDVSDDPPRARPVSHLRLFIALILLLMIMFAGLRAGLIWRNWVSGLASSPQIARAFVVGARFDFAIACLILAPIMVICYLPPTSPASGPWRYRVFLYGVSIVLGA